MTSRQKRKKKLNFEVKNLNDYNLRSGLNFDVTIKICKLKNRKLTKFICYFQRTKVTVE